LPALAERITVPRPPHRLERLRAWMQELEVDACVLLGADHVAHMSGYARYFGGPAALVIDREGARTLVVNIKEAAVAEGLAEADAVVSCGDGGLGFELDPVPGLLDAIAATGPVQGARRLGVADGFGGAKEAFGEAELVDAAPALARIRLVHDDDELVRLLHGYELCWTAQATVGELAVPGVTEIELFSAAHAAAQNAHGEPVEFVADLLSGSFTGHVGAPMHVPGSRHLEEGDAVLADIVVGAGGYWGDSAETHIAGENEAIAEVRAALLDVRAACAAELRPGTTAAAIFAGMRDRITARFPDGELPHHAGHGVGLTSFEDPHLIPTDHTPLESWMLIALEPGVYVQDRYGVRVENLYIVTPDGGVELRAAMGVA
jgi:Xaa-Pro aminopeptidase